MAAALKAPFPWFGGKSRVVTLVWQRLGRVTNYIEPFAGSIVMLLQAPEPARVETVNDLDCYVSNFWRATAWDKCAVVDALDWPINEADLHARHRWLVHSDEARAFRKRITTDPTYFDARIAGWWCWGLCLWIGGGWCTWSDGPGRRPASLNQTTGMGVHAGLTHQKRRPSSGGSSGAMKGVHAGRRPKLSGNGATGVHREPQQRPDISDGNGRGVHRKRPSLSDGHGGGGGKGIAARIPDLTGHRGGYGRGIMTSSGAGSCAERRAWLLNWFDALSDRLRNVRVCVGDWSRVCSSPSVTTRIGLTGVFLDPPYAHRLDRLAAWKMHLVGKGDAPAPGGRANRDAKLYATDQTQDVDRLVAEVHVWCAAAGGDKRMRIALCGYEGEHDELEALGWSVTSWTAHGGYANRSTNQNKHRERIWFSPACQHVDQTELFEAGVVA